MVFKGQGVVQNPAEGVQWLEKAAAQGHTYAQSILAHLLFAGHTPGGTHGSSYCAMPTETKD